MAIPRSIIPLETVRPNSRPPKPLPKPCRVNLYPAPTVGNLFPVASSGGRAHLALLLHLGSDQRKPAPKRYLSALVPLG